MSLTEGCVRCSEGEREHSEYVVEAQVDLVEIEGTCVSKNLDETVCLQSEKREEWIPEIREITRDC